MGEHIKQTPVCLTIGGSDSCGGAGIQADLRVFEQFGVKGCSVITALTAQNPQHILRIEPVSLAQLDAEIKAVFDYYDVAAVKTGMLTDMEYIATVSALLHEYHAGKPLVVDPVIVATSGGELFNHYALNTLRRSLIPQATLLTPNLDEATDLLGHAVEDPAIAAEELERELGCAVLLKGGHGKGDVLVDVLCDEHEEITFFPHPKKVLDVAAAHGTGCRLASAVAASLGLGMPLTDSVEAAINYLQERI